MSWKFHAAVLVCLAAGFSAWAADSGKRTQLASASGSWTQWRGPERKNISPDTGLLQSWEDQKPKLVWTAEGMGDGYASVSVANGRIYTTGNTEKAQSVICIDAKDGKVLWTSPVTDGVPKHSYEGSRCTPTIDGDRLYVVTSDGEIVCLKADSGDIVWKKDFKKEWNGRMMSGWGYSESPLVDGSWVLCTPGGKQAMIVALDKLTGKEIWRTAMPDLGGKGKDGAGYSSIVISNGGGVKQYVQLIGRGLIGVRASDGQFLWNYNDVANGTANIPTPLVDGDYIFASTGYQTGAALIKLVKDAQGVKVEEEYFLPADKLQNHHGGMVLKDGYVYCGHRHGQGFPICVKMETGEIMWGGKTRGAGNGSAAITYADGNLIFRYQSGEVALIEATPKDYNLKGSFRPDFVGKGPCWAQPVVAGGKLYLRDQDKLMCYDVKK